MKIEQFEDKNLSHYSYAVMSDCEKKIMLIDPARNPQPYIDYANQNEATIIGVIETHLHADFISSHLELHTVFNATVYVSQFAKASYPHQSFDEDDVIQLGRIALTAFNTPGHSPDSVCIVLEHDGKKKAVFTGDTLFIGDCGRPDLRADEGNKTDAANSLAKQLYNSLRDKLMPLPDDVIVYPAHGAGTLCGKALSKAASSNLGEEKRSNWALQPQSEEAFVKELLTDQPFIPAYFPFGVALNKKGAAPFLQSMKAVKTGKPIINKSAANALQANLWVIDARNESDYKKGHLFHSINLMNESKFETWLGSLIRPEEKYYLTAPDEATLQKVMTRTAAIGYETAIEYAFVLNDSETADEIIDIETFKHYPDNYTIVDVRNPSEVKEKPIFASSISIPLGRLRERMSELPADKPVVVHCASGFRSAAGSSLIQSSLLNQVTVFDLGTAVRQFM